VVEGTRLESVRTGNRTGGSNPPLSAIKALRKGSIPFVPFCVKNRVFLKNLLDFLLFVLSDASKNEFLWV
jgi:hypothetical protein